MTTLLKAHNQWKNRPADERFWDLNEMLQTAKVMKAQGVEKDGVTADLRVEAGETDLMLVGRAGVQAKVSNHAFGQLSARVGAPASYLRELPATLAAQNLNHGLKSLAEENAEKGVDTKLLFNVNGDIVLRALTTQRYSRYWNSDLLEKVIAGLPNTWKTPRAWPARLPGERVRVATAEDVMSGSIIQEGDEIAPAGCYLNDKNMFLFMIDTESEVRDGTAEPMHRGLILWNSEVGDRSLGLNTFLFKQACGNHRIIGATDIMEFSHRHIGDINTKITDSFSMTVRKLHDSSVSDLEAQIERERTMVLGKTKEEVVDAVLAFARKKKITALGKKFLEASYDKAVQHEAWYGNPNSLYGMSNGITEMVQVVTSNVDDRHDLDVAASKLMDMAIF